MAFTGQGYPCADSAHDDTQTRLKMLDSIAPGTVSVWSSGGSMDCGALGRDHVHSGEAARMHRCVIDGGVRDVRFCKRHGLPCVRKFKCSASSLGRWDIIDFQIPIKIGNTVVHPGDFVFGDTDGVVIIPKDVTMEVLVAAEGIFERESGMREELRRGVSVKDAYAKYGSL